MATKVLDSWIMYIFGDFWDLVVGVEVRRDACQCGHSMRECRLCIYGESLPENYVPTGLRLCELC